MFRTAAAVLLSATILLSDPTIAQDAPKEEWIPLFNGKDLSGWTPKIRGHAAGENAHPVELRHPTDLGQMHVDADDPLHAKPDSGQRFSDGSHDDFRLARDVAMRPGSARHIARHDPRQERIRAIHHHMAERQARRRKPGHRDPTNVGRLHHATAATRRGDTGSQSACAPDRARGSLPPG